MRIEAAETSLHLLLFPLPLGRGRWGLGQHSQGTPAPEILEQVFYQLQVWFVLVCFFQDPFPVTGFAWKPATLPSSKMQGEEQSRFPGSWGTCDPQTRIRFTWADRFTYCTASLAPHRPRAGRYQLPRECAKVQQAKIRSFSYFHDSGLDWNLKRRIRYSCCQIRTPQEQQGRI